ncbi:MAG TPA: hypothetical protein VF937_01240 [Chloroflexota bacterium]
MVVSKEENELLTRVGPGTPLLWSRRKIAHYDLWVRKDGRRRIVVQPRLRITP